LPISFSLSTAFSEEKDYFPSAQHITYSLNDPIFKAALSDLFDKANVFGSWRLSYIELRSFLDKLKIDIVTDEFGEFCGRFQFGKEYMAKQVEGLNEFAFCEFFIHLIDRKMKGKSPKEVFNLLGYNGRLFCCDSRVIRISIHASDPFHFEHRSPEADLFENQVL